ncbi:MAG: hypothetical protein M1819_000422 [Sarea resinae]|nr:MAG: hypothetical protein M1819_000422 [Sarea resinae]
MAGIFSDTSIASSGTFYQLKQADIKRIVEDNGGAYLMKVTDSCTHLVTSEKDIAKNGTKYQQAQSRPNVQIVSIDWLVESSKQAKRLDEASYLLSNQEEEDESPAPQATTNGKKRARDDRQDQDMLSDGIGTNGNAEDNTNEPEPKKHKDGENAKPKGLVIPLDEGCDLASTHSVYVDPSGTIFDAALNQTNVGANNNKFYRIQLLVSKNPKDCKVFMRWGRVGEHGQKTTLSFGSVDEALRGFEKKFRDKSGLAWSARFDTPRNKKYMFIEKNYEEDSSSDEADADDKAKSRKASGQDTEIAEPPLESTLPEPVQHLMELIFNRSFMSNAMADFSYDANKLPLGKLSKRTISNGFEALKEIAELLGNSSLASSRYSVSYQMALETLCNRFYTTIPRSFGRNRPPLIDRDSHLKREIDLLESLSDLRIADEIMNEAKGGNKTQDGIHPLDKQYEGLHLRALTPLDSKSDEFRLLDDYMTKSHGQTHGYNLEVEEIFRLEREGEHDRFNASPYALMKENSDRRLLWHGSRATNFGGILSQGLRIAPPEAPVSGYMFGKGVYLADISSKSAGYCCSHMSDNTALLLLCEAELGKPMYELLNGDYEAGEKAKAEGKIATWGKGRTNPSGWKDASCVHPSLKGVTMPDTTNPLDPTGVDGASLWYNEYIIYDVAQIKLRYLFRVKMGY